MAQETTTNKIDPKKIEFDIGKAIRYHEKRSRFYEHCDKFCNLVALMFGSATVATALQDFKGLGVAFGLLVALISAIALVWGFGKTSLQHWELKIKLHELYNELTCRENDERLLKIQRQFLDIEAGEPPKMFYVDFIAYNEQAAAMGYTLNYYLKLNWRQRFFANFTNYKSELVPFVGDLKTDSENKSA